MKPKRLERRKASRLAVESAPPAVPQPQPLPPMALPEPSAQVPSAVRDPLSPLPKLGAQTAAQPSADAPPLDAASAAVAVATS